MDILSVSLFGHKRALILSIVSILALASLMPLLMAAPAVASEEEIPFSPMALQPGQRSGTHSLDDYPAEYNGNGEDRKAYFGAKIEKLDFNGDGEMDIAFSAPGDSSIYIYNGSKMIKFPNLSFSPSTASWTLSGSGKMGTDYAVGDVNGDGAHDVLAMDFVGYSGNKGYLFYGGDHPEGSVSSSASFREQSYGYYGSWCALGDLNGDGLDDVITGDAGYRYTYSWGYPRTYYYYYGEANWWFSESGNDFSGSYSYSSADGRLTPPYSYGYTYSWGSYSYHYGYFGSGGASTGDMNGDGRDELVMGCTGYQGTDRQYNSGALMIMYPMDTIEQFTTDDALDTNPHVKWTAYTGRYYDNVGGDPLVHDYNDDGYADVTFNTGYYSYGSGSDNGKYCWVVDGSPTIDEGVFKIDDKYDKRFEAGSSTHFGSHTYGDFDGDGKDDIVLGNTQDGEVYVVLYDDYATTTGTIDAQTVASFTVTEPRGSSKFAPSVDYWRYYYYDYGHVYRPLLMLNRDDDGLDDLFISDPYRGYNGVGTCGVVYGISNYDMFGIGTFSAADGDLPDGRTFYAEYKSYKYTGSAWNKWNVYGSEMSWDFIIGNYHATIQYMNPTMTHEGAYMQESEDEFDIIQIEPGSLKLFPDNDTDMLRVEFKVMFTRNLPVEGDLDVGFKASVAHIEYYQMLEEVGYVKNRFKFVGEMDSRVDEKGNMREVLDNGWVQEDSILTLTGMKLVYNGTENFMQDFEVEPFYPSDEMFNITLINSLGYTDVDNSSSGRDFSVSAEVGDRPLAIEFQVGIEGIPTDRLIEIPDPFTVRVDVDVPTAPPGVRVHADSFDDVNTIVDNEGELYVTWHEPGEFNSGIAYYEAECNDVITTTDVTFAKVMTDKTGTIEVKVRAIDRVGHVGEWTTSSIYIDMETLEYTSYNPGEDVWMNTLTPQVGITITDLGGRAIIGNSVMYTVSHDGGETWGEWTSAELDLNAKTLDVLVQPMCAEGGDNMIMFRASDEAGNIIESEPYMIHVDTMGVEFTGMMVDDNDQWQGVWLPDTDVNIKVMMNDVSSGVDGSTFEYRFTTRGRADLNSAPWMPATASSGVEVTADLGTMELDNGDRNYIQFRARDLVGNGYTYSEAYNIWIDTIPVINILSPEMDSEYLEDEMVLFDATMTYDTDGDLLTYTWMTSYGDVTDMVIGEDLEETIRFDQLLPIGMHTITLTVSDGVHEVVSHPIHVNITERIIPRWYSMEDEDGDGMPNYWEYTYYLGWDNDGANKDTMYNPSTMKDIPREQLFTQLIPNFRNETSAVTDANDADGDGHTDFEEYLAGTDPTDALSFPVYEPIGKEREESENYFLPILLLICLVVIIIVIVVVLLSSAAIKKDLEKSRIKEAENERALMENALSSGGQERLDRLLAAAKGEGAPALPGTPGGQPTAEALPSAEPTAQPMDAQPMQAAPMGQPMPEGQQQQ